MFHGKTKTFLSIQLLNWVVFDQLFLFLSHFENKHFLPILDSKKTKGYIAYISIYIKKSVKHHVHELRAAQLIFFYSGEKPLSLQYCKEIVRFQINFHFFFGQICAF